MNSESVESLQLAVLPAGVYCNPDMVVLVSILGTSKISTIQRVCAQIKQLYYAQDVDRNRSWLN